MRPQKGQDVTAAQTAARRKMGALRPGARTGGNEPLMLGCAFAAACQPVLFRPQQFEFVWNTFDATAEGPRAHIMYANTIIVVVSVAARMIPFKQKVPLDTLMC